jgi:hypothetical protein
MVRGSEQLDDVARDLIRASGDAMAVSVAEGAFGRLPQSMAVHSALDACTGRVTQDLDRLRAAITDTADGVVAGARGYTELNRAGSDRLGELAG